MNSYELMYIIRPDIEQDTAQSFMEKIQGIVNQGGELVKEEVIGKRRLAYEINKHREGTYVLVEFNGTAEILSELERVLRISDEVIRHMIVKAHTAKS